MAIALTVTVAFMFALRPVAKSIKLVDLPGGRKAHDGEVPVMGGIAMFIGVIAGLTIVEADGLHLPSLLTAALVLITIGALDDRYGLPPAVRVAAQIGAVLMMVYGADVLIESLGNPLGVGEIRLGPLSLAVTVLVSLTVINAYNLIDGVDGLAGSLAMTALMSIVAAGGLTMPSTAVALTVVASIAGFLLFNFPAEWNKTARTFMGDAGSTFLGFAVIWTGLAVSQGETASIAPVYCLWFASIPIFDLVTCVTRRLVTGKSPIQPGRDHFHHVLKRGGMGVRSVLGVMTFFQAAHASIALVALYYGVSEIAMMAAWLLLLVTQRSIFKVVARYSRLKKLKGRVKIARRVA